MKRTRKTLSLALTITLVAVAMAFTSASCNRMVTYEDGMFDYNEIYTNVATDDLLQINSEIDNDDTERY